MHITIYFFLNLSYQSVLLKFLEAQSPKAKIFVYSDFEN